MADDDYDDVIQPAARDTTRREWDSTAIGTRSNRVQTTEYYRQYTGISSNQYHTSNPFSPQTRSAIASNAVNVFGLDLTAWYKIVLYLFFNYIGNGLC